jgi:hypothetical protein
MKLPDGQGWFSAALFALTIMVLGLAAFVPGLRQDDLFKTIAQAIVLTGLINLAASYYFGASKSGPPAGSAPPAESPPAAAPPAAAEPPAP